MLSPTDGRVSGSNARLFGVGPAWQLAALVAVFAGLVLWLIVRPLDRVTVDTDATATVAYFERIVHGQRLEAFWPTTPKPLLTFVYGFAWQLTGDWRSTTVLTVVVAALAIGLAARLATRLGGPAAGAIVVVAMLAWPDFQLETAHANSFVWGLALWLLAAVLITADHPHPWPAGLALILAGLARTETVWIFVAVAGAAAAAAFQAWRSGDRRDLRTILPLLIGVLALPLACLHDLILTGKPLYWLGVPSGYTALTYPQLRSISPLTEIGKELAYFKPAAPIALLAVAGVVWLALRGRPAIAFALTCIAGGVLGTIVVLAWRTVYISVRYYEEADAAILLAAAVAAAVAIRWVSGAAIAAIPRPGSGASSADAPSSRPATQVLAVGLAALLALSAVALDVPRGTLDPQVTATADSFADLGVVIGRIEPIVRGASGATTTVSGVGYPVADAGSCRMFVPRDLLPAISVETGAPITALGDSTLAFRDGSYADLHPGQWILHLASFGGRGGVFAPFELSRPGSVGNVQLTPVFVDAGRGIWLLRVDASVA